MAAVRQLNAKAEVLGRSAALAMSCGAGKRGSCRPLAHGDRPLPLPYRRRRRQPPALALTAPAAARLAPLACSQGPV